MADQGRSVKESLWTFVGLSAWLHLSLSLSGKRGHESSERFAVQSSSCANAWQGAHAVICMASGALRAPTEACFLCLLKDSHGATQMVHARSVLDFELFAGRGQMLDGQVLGASQVEYEPFGKPPLQREVSSLKSSIQCFARRGAAWPNASA